MARQIQTITRTATIAVDHGSLSSAETPMGTQYTVRLAGELTERWCASYRMGQRGVAVLTRLRLNEGVGAVAFNLKRNEGPAEVIDMLDRLGEFVARVNREVQAA